MEELENRLVYTIEQVAEILMVSTATVWSLIRSGKLSASKITGRIYRITKEDLDAFLKENRV